MWITETVPTAPAGKLHHYGNFALFNQVVQAFFKIFSNAAFCNQFPNTAVSFKKSNLPAVGYSQQKFAFWLFDL